MDTSEKDEGPQNNVQNRSSSSTQQQQQLNRQKLEEEIGNLMVKIQALDKELKSHTSKSGESAYVRLREIRSTRDATFTEMKKIEEDLQTLNKNIDLKRESLMKVKANLLYKSEDKINEFIRRLEYQLANQTFRLPEGKKIKQEIERLKKSKKSLNGYMELQKELDQMRKQQNIMRSTRDSLYRKKTTLRADEDSAKDSITKSRMYTDQLKKEIDELYSRKRKLVSDFRLASKEILNLNELCQHHQKLSNSNSLSSPSSASPSPNVPAVKDKVFLPEKSTPTYHLPALTASTSRSRRISFCADPYSEEITVCNILVHYLQRLVSGSDVATPDSPFSENSSIANTPVASTPVSEIQFGDSVMVMYKREEDEPFGGNSYIKVSNPSKKKRDKRMKKKSVIFTPDVLEKFNIIHLNPPGTYLDILNVLENVHVKKSEYEHLQKIEMERALPSTSKQLTTLPSFSAQLETVVETFKSINFVNPVTAAAESSRNSSRKSSYSIREEQEENVKEQEVLSCDPIVQNHVENKSLVKDETVSVKDSNERKPKVKLQQLNSCDPLVINATELVSPDGCAHINNNNNSDDGKHTDTVSQPIVVNGNLDSKRFESSCENAMPVPHQTEEVQQKQHNFVVLSC